MSEEIWDQEGFMTRIMDSEKIAERLIALFNSETPKTINALEAALEQENIDDIILFAHTIKGSANTLGGHALANLSHQIENAGRESKLDEAKNLWPDVKPQFEQLLECINQR